MFKRQQSKINITLKSALPFRFTEFFLFVSRLVSLSKARWCRTFVFRTLPGLYWVFDSSLGRHLPDAAERRRRAAAGGKLERRLSVAVDVTQLSDHRDLPAPTGSRHCNVDDDRPHLHALILVSAAIGGTPAVDSRHFWRPQRARSASPSTSFAYPDLVFFESDTRAPS